MLKKYEELFKASKNVANDFDNHYDGTPQSNLVTTEVMIKLMQIIEKIELVKKERETIKSRRKGPQRKLLALAAGIEV